MDPEIIRNRIERLNPAGRAALAERLARLSADAGSMTHNSGDGRKRLVAYVVSDQQSTVPSDALVDELKGSLRRHLPDHMIPQDIVPLPELPRLANGKLDVNSLTLPESHTAEAESSFVEPRTESERKISAIWVSLLGMDAVSVHDNFYEIGGDSIISIQFISRAREAGMQLDPHDLIDYPTIAELAGHVGKEAGRAVNTDHRSGRIPLTPIQHWFFERDFAVPDHWNQASLYEFSTEVDEDSLRKAIDHCVAVHDVFRIRFRRVDSRWIQEIRSVDRVGSLLEVQNLSPAEFSNEAFLERHVGPIQSQLDTESGRLAAFVLFRVPNQPQRLLIIIHHLIVDVLSWATLIESLVRNYECAVAGESMPEPDATSFGVWAEWLTERASEFRSELNYWIKQQVKDTELPPDYACRKTYVEGMTQSVVCSLSQSATRELIHETHHSYSTRPQDLLVAALFRTLCRHTGKSRCQIGLEFHGRDSSIDGLDVSRTIGWLTAYFPVLLTLPDADDPGSTVRYVKESLLSIPGGGIGYGVLRYLSDDAAVRSALSSHGDPQILFNYVGTAAGLKSTFLRQIDDCSRTCRHPQNQRSHTLEINSSVTDGRLSTVWIFNGSAYRQETIDGLAADFITELEVLIDHCRSAAAGSFTSSDFPESELSQSELDDFLDSIPGL